MNKMRKNNWCFGLMIAVALFLTGCAASGMKDVKQSGFLDNYDQLKPGGDDRAALLYVKSGVDFRKYDALMFERVTIYLSAEAENSGIDPAVMKELTDYYQNALISAAKDGYNVVDQPGPGVMRVRVAITDVKPSKPTANTLSSIIPVGMVVAATTKAVSDDNMGTGEAATEMEFLDAQSGERLAAAVDRRQGGKAAFRGKWKDTKDAFDYWAKRFRERLDELRGM